MGSCTVVGPRKLTLFSDTVRKYFSCPLRTSHSLHAERFWRTLPACLRSHRVAGQERHRDCTHYVVVDLSIRRASVLIPPVLQGRKMERFTLEWYG